MINEAYGLANFVWHTELEPEQRYATRNHSSRLATCKQLFVYLATDVNQHETVGDFSKYLANVWLVLAQLPTSIDCQNWNVVNV